MNPSRVHHRVSIMGLLILTGGFPGRSLPAQDPGWRTLDEFRYRGFPGLSTQPRGVLADRQGNLLVCGFAHVGAGCSPEALLEPCSHWLVRRSQDDGRTWETVDDFYFDSLLRSTPWPRWIGMDRAGHVYVAGSYVVRRSTDGGSSWLTVHYEPEDELGFEVFLVSHTGDALYIDGQRSGLHESRDSGESWQLVSGPTGRRRAMVDSPRGLFAWTVRNQQTPDELSVIEVSADGGRSWSDVDLISVGDPYWQVTDLMADASGTVYASLTQWGDEIAGVPSLWILKRSADGGSTWDTISKQSSANSPWYLEETILAADSAGAIFAAGAGRSLGGSTWTTLKSTDQGVNWRLSDVFGTDYNWPLAITIDARDNVYVVSPQRAPNARGQMWFVRALASQDSGDLPFRRGDSNEDKALDLSDAVSTLEYLFRGGRAPACPDAADANDDGRLDLSDAVYTLNALFLGGPQPPAPGTDGCGPDPTEDELSTCKFSGVGC